MQVTFQHRFPALGQSQQVMEARTRRGLPILRPSRDRGAIRKSPGSHQDRRWCQVDDPSLPDRGVKGLARWAEQTFAIEEPAPRISAGVWSRSAGIPANASMIAASVAFEAEIMGSRRGLPAMPPQAKQRNRSFRSAYDGPDIPISQGTMTFRYCGQFRPGPETPVKFRISGCSGRPIVACVFSSRSRFPAARAATVNKLFFSSDFGEDRPRKETNAPPHQTGPPGSIDMSET